MAVGLRGLANPCRNLASFSLSRASGLELGDKHARTFLVSVHSEGVGARGRSGAGSRSSLT